MFSICPICASPSHTPTAHPDYRRCGDCGSFYQSSPVFQIADYYAEIEEVPDFRRQSGSYRNYIKRISSVLGDLRRHYLVDVGGGDGLFALMAQDLLRVRDVAVVESSATAQESLRKKGVTVLEFDQIATLDTKVVTALQVIEHIADPKEFLLSLGLSKGDSLVLTSPSTDTIYCRMYGKCWRSYSPSHHLILYSRRGIEILLESAGLELVHYEHCVSGAHSRLDELVRFGARVALWPIRRWGSAKQGRIQLFHGKSSFLAIARVLDGRSGPSRSELNN